MCKEFWSLGSIERQRDFISNNVEESEVISRQKGKTEKKQVSRRYFLPNGEKVRVCRSFMCSTLNISEQMVKTALAKRTASLMTKEDLRGKHTPANKTPADKVKYVEEHIRSFPTIVMCLDTWSLQLWVISLGRKQPGSLQQRIR